jgi:hypothetical protein
MMAVQLDEASAFLVRESVSHARLAFILLDNAAEVIMRRNIEARLTHNKTMERVLRQWKEILERDPADAEARRHHDEVAREVVPRSARKELARSFDAKVDFIRDRGDIQETESRVLKKLHRYRNELYHRDRIRPETVRSAAAAAESTCHTPGNVRHKGISDHWRTPCARSCSSGTQANSALEPVTSAHARSSPPNVSRPSGAVTL